MANTSRFIDLVQDPPIEVFELTRQFNEDNHPNKVNLGVGCKNFNLLVFL
jgi:aspartate/tyrosine/aromatic aminotransferase